MTMSRIRLALAGTLISACAAFLQPAVAGAPQWAKGHILVKPSADASDSTFSAALDHAGAKSKGKLGNENFVNNAPPAVVTQERERLSDFQRQLEQLAEQRQRLDLIG